jgi:hypothetical protein
MDPLPIATILRCPICEVNLFAVLMNLPVRAALAERIQAAKWAATKAIKTSNTTILLLVEVFHMFPLYR